MLLLDNEMTHVLELRLNSKLVCSGHSCINCLPQLEKVEHFFVCVCGHKALFLGLWLIPAKQTEMNPDKAMIAYPPFRFVGLVKNQTLVIWTSYLKGIYIVPFVHGFTHCLLQNVKYEHTVSNIYLSAWYKERSVFSTTDETELTLSQKENRSNNKDLF